MRDEWKRVMELKEPFKGAKGVKVTATELDVAKAAKKKSGDLEDFNPYEFVHKKSNLPGDWTTLLPCSFTNKWCNIKEIADWAIEQGNTMFEGSTRQDNWMIYHDRLSQWWEKECQEYIKERGFGDRQWKLRGASNRKVTKYYKHSIFGDSPELQPLDSSLFALVKDWVRKMFSITHHRAIGDDGKWSMATHKDSYKTVSHAFAKLSSEEIIKDIDRTQHALVQIIAHRGTIVPDLDNRSGHRKDASRKYLGGKLAGLCDEDAAALEEQLNLSRGVSGARAGL